MGQGQKMGLVERKAHLQAIQKRYKKAPMNTKERGICNRGWLLNAGPPTKVTEKWAYFFKRANTTDERDLPMIVGTDTILQKAYDELNRYSWSIEEIRAYDSVDMKQASDRAVLRAAKEEGLKEGEENEKAKIAISLFTQGINLRTIAMATGLSESDIEKK